MVHGDTVIRETTEGLQEDVRRGVLRLGRSLTDDAIATTDLQQRATQVGMLAQLGDVLAACLVTGPVAAQSPADAGEASEASPATKTNGNGNGGAFEGESTPDVAGNVSREGGEWWCVDHAKPLRPRSGGKWFSCGTKLGEDPQGKALWCESKINYR